MELLLQRSGTFTRVYLRMSTQMATNEYASRVPMDMRSTRAARSKKKAIKAGRRNKHLGGELLLMHIRLAGMLIKRQKLTGNDARGDGSQERGLGASVHPGQDTEEESIFRHGVNDPGHWEH